jgi:hypothetical protein
MNRSEEIISDETDIVIQRSGGETTISREETEESYRQREKNKKGSPGKEQKSNKRTRLCLVL